MRWIWLRSREHVHKRYLVRLAGDNLDVLMRAALLGGAAPEGASKRQIASLVIYPGLNLIAYRILAAPDTETAALFVAMTSEVD